MIRLCRIIAFRAGGGGSPGTRFARRYGLMCGGDRRRSFAALRMTGRGGSDRTCPAASSSGESHPSKLPLTPSYPLHQLCKLMGRESPGEVSRNLIESPLAVPEEVFAALPRLRSTYSTAAPSSPCSSRPRRRKARHPPYPSHNSERVEGAPEKRAKRS